jgi:hypothetical protein
LFLQQEPVPVIIAEDSGEAGAQLFQRPERKGRGEISGVNDVLHVSGIEKLHRPFQGRHVVVRISDYSDKHCLDLLS